MQKIGSYQLGKDTGTIISFNENNSFIRIDIIDDLSDYNIINTDNCTASFIFDRKIHTLGDYDMIKKLQRIKAEAATMPVAESKTTRFEDGAFYIDISKINNAGTLEYKNTLKNGVLCYEYYRDGENYIEYNEIRVSSTYGSIKPVNYDLYNIENSELVQSLKDDVVSTKSSKFYSYETLLQKYPEVRHVLDNDYVVVRDYDEAVSRLNDWINSTEQLKSFDIESRDKTWGPSSNNRITGVFLGYGETWSTYFPFRQDNFEYNLPIEFLRRIFDAINDQPPAPEVILLAHNVKFEIQGFYQEFRDYVRCDCDTYLLSVLIDPVLKKGSHTLKNLTRMVDSHFYLSLEDIFIGPVQFNVLPPDIVKLYGCPDATSPAKIYKYLMNKLPKDEKFVLSLENKLPVIKALQEFYGMRLDQERLVSLIKDKQEVVDILSDTFKKMHHTSANINSYDTMADILYNKLRCKVEVRTKNGAPATNKTAIDKIIRTGVIKVDHNTPKVAPITKSDGTVIISSDKLMGNKYPSLIVYQEYKKCTKELGALKRLRDHSINGFFHFYINQSGAGSNRQTSDAHQFSDAMKSCAVSDSKYHGLVSCDWKQVELRILAGLAGQEDLMKLEADENVDIHRAILSIIQGKPMYLISDEERKAGKSVNFGVVYMMSEYGLANKDFGPGYTKENLETERKKIMDFYNGLPKIKAFIKNNEEKLKRDGFIETAFGYYRYFPELLDPSVDNKKKSSMIRAGNNTPVQGTGAQMLKIVECKVWKWIRDHGWDKEKDYDGVKLPMVRQILPIHDEILLSYDLSIPKEEIIKMFKECMELDIKGFPPFYAAPAFVNNWGDGKDDAYEIPLPLRDDVIEEYDKGNLMLTGKDYLTVLNDYREKQLKGYMDGLIAKYKTVDEVAKHVTDDTLTHTLINTVDKSIRKSLTHEERIHKAVEQYMSGVEQVTIDVHQEKDDATQYMPLEEWENEYGNIDENGEIIETESEEDDPYYDDYEQNDSQSAYNIENERIIFMQRECLIDFTGLDDEVAESINKSIQEMATGGYYNIIYIMNNKVVKTDMYIEYAEDALNKLFDKESKNG